MKFYHLDVFSDKPLCGNGVTVVFMENEVADSVLLGIAQEFKQFETVFVYPEVNNCFPIRIFTVQEELAFAGHPLLGTAAIVHALFFPEHDLQRIALSIGKRVVNLDSEVVQGTYSVTMNQGIPEFIRTVSKDDYSGLAAYFNLSPHDISEEYPVEVVSTGLEYVLLPVIQNIENAKIVKKGLEEYISRLSAKFVYVFDPVSLECRSWDNTGVYEDVATGSAAGPLIAYLVKNGYRKKDEVVRISQGRFLNRQSEIKGWVSSSNPHEVFIEGKVAFFGEGTIHI